MKTVKFWTYQNGSPVKIKMRQGDVLHHVSGGPTDEGWHYEMECWEFDGEWVSRNSTSKGLDCDGRLDTYAEATCHVTKMRDGYVEREDNVVYPAWDWSNESQRDYAAEAMGY